MGQTACGDMNHSRLEWTSLAEGESRRAFLMGIFPMLATSLLAERRCRDHEPRPISHSSKHS